MGPGMRCYERGGVCRGQSRPRGSDKQIPGCTLLCGEEELKGPQGEAER